MLTVLGGLAKFEREIARSYSHSTISRLSAPL
jgi:hypothetical protein